MKRITLLFLLLISSPAFCQTSVSALGNVNVDSTGNSLNVPGTINADGANVTNQETITTSNLLGSFVITNTSTHTSLLVDSNVNVTAGGQITGGGVKTSSGFIYGPSGAFGQIHFLSASNRFEDNAGGLTYPLVVGNLYSSEILFPTNTALSYTNNASAISNALVAISTTTNGGLAFLTSQSGVASSNQSLILFPSGGAAVGASQTDPGSGNMSIQSSLTVSGNITAGNGANTLTGTGITTSQKVTLSGTATNNTIQGNSGAYVRTNFIDGQLYTNNYGAPIQVSTKAILTTTGVSGNVCEALEMAGNETNQSGISTLVTSIAQSYTNVLSGIVTNNGTYVFTNRSSGAGDSGTILGGQIIIY